MANWYATPTNAEAKLGYTLIELLNLPNSSQAAVVMAAEELRAGQAISTPVTVLEEAAARRLYRACLTANAQIDTGLRGTYPLPLRMADGTQDPDNPEFYPDIVGHAISMVKWELLAARKGFAKTEADRQEYEDALRYFGLPTEGGGAGVSGTLVGVDITGIAGTAGPRGATVVQVGNPEKTRERRQRMSNAGWQEEF